MCNCVRELSKVMQEGTIGHFRQMLRAVKFVCDTQSKGLQLKPKILQDKYWYMNTYVDSDCGGDRDTRSSVSGWAIFVNEALVGWGSRGPKGVTCSSTESEYVGLSEIFKPILLIKQVLEFLGVKVKFPIIINVDNVGAIYLANNSDGRRTKHVDIRYHFVREYIEDGIVKVVFVKSKDNIADPYKKM